MRGAGPRPKFAPAERRRDDDEDIERELKTLAVDRDEDENHAGGKDEEFHDGSHDDGFRPSPPRDGFDGGIPPIRSPKSRARVRFSEGGGRPGHVRIRSRDVLRATLGTEDWGEFRDARADGRGASSRGGAASSARFSVHAAPRRRRGGDLDWFEDVRSKAMRQRGLPSTRFLSVWGDKLGTKADRIRDEAHVAAVRKGLRGRAWGVDEYDDA